jgi:hypothetical protein
MTNQNALANAKLPFKALAAGEANLDEPIPNIRITDVAVQIGLEGDEFDSALDYAADQGWFEDAEVGDSASWVSLTPAWCGRCEILILTARNPETGSQK